MSEAATVYLVDDDVSSRRALSSMLRAAGFDVRCFASAAELLAQVCPETRGCVVMSLSLSSRNASGLQELSERVRAQLPVIILTECADPGTVRATYGDAVDFLQKGARQEELLTVVRSALERDAAGREARTRIAELRRRFARLTPREHEVLRHVLSGRMNKQIAASLGINERTVKLHRTAICAKIGVHSAVQLAMLAREVLVF
jgi:two-component system, LuxR family, response regulator FixJ